MSTETTPPKEPGDEGITEFTLTVPFPDTFVYSNVSAISVSLMDIRISFAEALPDKTAHPRVGICMPAEHAAILVMNLLTQIHVFEHNFGEIRHPEWRKFQAQAKSNAATMGQIRRAHQSTLPFDPTQVANFEVGIPGTVAVNFKDGTQRIFEGEELTDDIKQFIALNTAKKPR